MRKKSIFFIIAFMFLFSLTFISAETFGYGRTEEIPINYSDIVINETSNQSEYWNTNIGSLGGVDSNDFQKTGENLDLTQNFLRLDQNNWGNDSFGYSYWDGNSLETNETKLNSTIDDRSLSEGEGDVRYIRNNTNAGYNLIADILDLRDNTGAITRGLDWSPSSSSTNYLNIANAVRLGFDGASTFIEAIDGASDTMVIRAMGSGALFFNFNDGSGGVSIYDGGTSNNLKLTYNSLQSSSGVVNILDSAQIDNLNFNSNVIDSNTGTVSFGNDATSTTGQINGGALDIDNLFMNGNTISASGEVILDPSSSQALVSNSREFRMNSPTFTRVTMQPGTNSDANIAFWGDRLYQIQVDGDGSISPTDSFNIRDDTAGVVRLTLSTAGDIGIGDTTPDAKLDVAGDILADGDITTKGNIFTDAIRSFISSVVEFISDVLISGDLNVTENIHANGNISVDFGSDICIEGYNCLDSVKADNYIFINDINDLPIPTDTADGLGTAYRLDSKVYVIGQDLNLTYPIVGNAITTIRGGSNVTLHYSGSGGLFISNPTTPIGNLEIKDIIITNIASNQIFNISGSEGIFISDSDIIGVGSLGTISNISGSVILHIVGFNNFNSGLILENVTALVAKIKSMLVSSPVGGAYLTVKGTVGFIDIESVFITPLSGDSAFDLDSDLIADSVTITNSIINLDSGGTAFKNGSLDQTDPGVISSNTRGIPDSSARGSLRIIDNVLTTTISSANTPVPINTLWTDGTQERMRFQDNCTFTSITDIITTTFNHGLSNGSMVSFVENGGLPTGLIEGKEYFVLEDTATTFQVEATPGGGAVDFSTNGTTPNYYRHSIGNSSSGWLVYIGIEDIFISINGFVSAQMDVGVAKEIGTVVMKTETDFTENAVGDGSSASPSNVITQSSSVASIIQLSTNEGFKIYIENRVDTVDIDVLDASIVVHKS